MILGDNSAGHCFALWDLALIALFPVSHNYVTECASKSFVKTCPNATVLEIPFFPVCDIFIQQKGKV